MENTTVLNKQPDISVIIPIYNVAEYLKQCLDSIVNQTKDNLEVIMIDDGSVDSSADIAKEYELKYDYFHYYYEENAGLGHARNYGVTLATGKYITFVDSDDIVVRNAYEKMFVLAEKNKSDMAVCNVARFNSKKFSYSNLHRIAFTNLEQKTHITKNHRLLYDTTSWNKLILKSFWDKHGFKFPENILYEDIPVTLPMHFLADNVSMLGSIGYLWRQRDGATKSITQNISDMKNLTDRLAVLKMVDDFFSKNCTDKELLLSKQIKACEIDLIIFVNACNKMPREQAEKVLALLREYIESSVSEEAFDRLNVIHRQKLECVLNGDLDGLINILEHQSADYYNAPIDENDGKFTIRLNDSVYTTKNKDMSRELTVTEPRKYINDIIIDSEKIIIFGHIYFPKINISNFSQQKVCAYLYNELTDVRTPLETEPVFNYELTETRGLLFNSETGEKTEYNYDCTGFRITLDLNTLDINENNMGINKILMEYENRLAKGRLYLGNTTPNIRKKTNANTLLVNQSLARIYYSYFNEIEILISREENFAQEVICKENQVLCRLEKDESKIFAKCAKDEEKICFIKSGPCTFYAPIHLFENDKKYDLFIEKAHSSEQNLLSRKKKITAANLDDRACIIRSNRTHCVNINFVENATLADEVTLDGNIVSIKTSKALSRDENTVIKDAVICIDNHFLQKKDILSKSKCTLKNDRLVCRFKIDFNDENMKRNFYQSTRTVFIEYRTENGEILRDYIYSSKYFNFKMSFETLKIDFYRYMMGYINIKLEQVWKEEENTAQKRKALTFENYPRYRQEKIHPKRIMFESMWGSKYSCNPQQLYEYIDKNYPEYECIWSLKDARTPIKGNGIRVRRGSQEYFYYLATSKYFINNVNFEDAYEKRDGQIEIQTMHGTPLKTLGLDVESDFPTQSSIDRYVRKNARWDYLVVQGRFMRDKAYSCFKFDKKVLCCGYPRTDKLFNKNPDKIQNLKKKLHLPPDKKIILYTPTWRVKNKFDMQLDLEKMRETLSDEYVLLIRLHHFSSSGYTIPADDKFIFNFNSYGYVEDLYMLSDILITDYSSVMFDYALLGKPMLFFTYDLEDYRENLRGIYVDIEKEAPGPLVFDTDGVINAIVNIDSEMKKYRKKIEAFHQKYLTYENPDSCQKIVSKVFKETPVKRKLKKLIKKVKA